MDTRQLAPKGVITIFIHYRVGTFGFLGEYGLEKKVSKYSSVTATVSIGVPSGVILKFKCVNSKLSLPPIHHWFISFPEYFVQINRMYFPST